ncbi:MAG: hypothetical protein JSU77_13180 [Fidelibacterota bacterium]|nr:MAG: hypothetical protein JSU77_13180 [Candidatus Neomarinimicrobiota bacterium]
MPTRTVLNQFGFGFLVYLVFLPTVRTDVGAVLYGAEPSQFPRRQISFRRTFGGDNLDEGSCVQQTSDGGYIITGMTASFGDGDWNTWLVKVDPEGAEQWSRTFGIATGQYEGGESLQETVDGGFIIVGTILSSGPNNYDVQLIKTNGNGRRLWSETFGGGGWDWGRSVRQTSDGGFIITGWTDSRGAGGGDLWLVKTDARGTEEWNRTYGGIENDYGNCIQPTADGGYIITGATISGSVGNDDLWLIKTDSAGTAQWRLMFGGKGYEEGHFVQTTSDGGYIVVGSTTSSGAGESDVWLIKLGPDGRTDWTRTFGGPEWDWGNTVHEVPDGGYILVGTTLSFGAGSSDIWLIKTDADGQEEWNRTYGGHSLDFGLSVQPTTDGGYIIAGQTYSFGAGSGDLWLIKTDSKGQAVY